MKTLTLSAALVLALAAPAVAADPVEGIWKTAPDDNGNWGHVQIAPCGAKLCGALVRSFDAQGVEFASPHVGRAIVWDMVPEGGGKYGGGRVWAPDRDRTYRAKMELSGATLAVSGCVLGGAVCRASRWTR